MLHCCCIVTAALHFNSLQHADCNTLQHTATHRMRMTMQPQLQHATTQCKYCIVECIQFLKKGSIGTYNKILLRIPLQIWISEFLNMFSHEAGFASFLTPQIERKADKQQLLATQCPVLYRTAPHCTALHRTAPHCTALHRTAPHCSAQHNTAPHCTTLHRTAPHCTALHPTAPHCTPHCTTLHQTFVTGGRLGYIFRASS